MNTFDSAPIHIREWLRRFGVARVMRAWPFLLLVGSIVWLLGFSIGEIPEEIAVGVVAPYDIRADRQYSVVNEDATAQRRAEALRQVRTVYDYDVDAGTQVIERIQQSFRQGRLWETDAEDTNSGASSSAILSEARETFETTLAYRVTDQQWASLITLQWGTEVEQAIVGIIEQLNTTPVVVNREALVKERERGIVIRTIKQQEGKQTISEAVWEAEAFAQITAVEQIRDAVKLDGLGTHAQGLRALVVEMLQANCAPNLLETEARRSRAIQGVPPVTETVKAGEMIVRRYEPYDDHQVRILRAIRGQKSAGSWPAETVGYGLYAALILLLLHTFGRRHMRKYRPSTKDVIFLGSFLVLLLVIMRFGGFFSEALSEGLPLPIPREAYYYLIPLATGGMMVRFLLNAEVAIVFSIVVSAFASIIFPHDPSFTAYVLIANIAGAMMMGHVDKRSAIIRAGVITGLVMQISVAAMHLMRSGGLSEVMTPESMFWYMTLAFSGAVFSSFVVMALTPLAETIFDYTSDIKLLELANLNHPLLRELVIRAPGTYHHSHLVGILAEAGADAIGANPLLARVGAYYHDIGKIRKPGYFTENQKGRSPHDRLNPHMSALIIASHVKEGIELARTYKLPQVIIDMIPQHHGTKQIGFFYERAKEAADPALEAIDEKDFRYPGPKPQTREAGLLLLSDGIEGAVRALKEKSPVRIQQTVDSILNKSFAEGQLDECELTLKDLHEIGKAFTRILLGIYHQRVEYPREVLQLRETDVAVVDSSHEAHDDPDPTGDDAPHARSSS
jgi:cyclic-di-AMP phosphodiesterase PgpH